MTTETVTTVEEVGPVEIFLKEVSQYTLIGAMSANFKDQKSAEVDSEVHIVYYQCSEDLDWMEEVNTLAITYPNAHISIRRDGTRDLWGMKKSTGRKKKVEEIA
jgi:hypothetical protein